ncbi:hypothetical protein SK128_008417 [Halocaridina rubra]|uniref:C2H2-type domain-containing protein n=1 Tax=Halocaridina rubra TaxID=373956 RepID=A0AAN8X9S4_HALRR
MGEADMVRAYAEGGHEVVFCEEGGSGLGTCKRGEAEMAPDGSCNSLFPPKASRRDGQRPDDKCPVCQKGFRCAAELRRHYLIHTGEKPHKCPYCFFRSARKGNVRSHMVTKHGDVMNAKAPDHFLSGLTDTS